MKSIARATESRVLSPTSHPSIFGNGWDKHFPLSTSTKAGRLRVADFERLGRRPADALIHGDADTW